jgi:hypothetical protein
MHLRTRFLHLAVAVVAAVAAPPMAHAQPITYTFTGSARVPGLGPSSHDLQFVFGGNAGSAIDVSTLGSPFSSLPANTVFGNLATTADVTIDGSGPFGLGSGPFFIGALNGLSLPSPYASLDPYTKGVGFLGEIGGTFVAFYLPDPTMPHYDLGSSFGPITGTGYAYVGDPGKFSLRSVITVDNASFTATTATPEPATYVLMATGLVAIAGIARRRRQTA